MRRTHIPENASGAEEQIAQKNVMHARTNTNVGKLHRARDDRVCVSGSRLLFYKLLDRAPLRFAPRSTVLPAWLAPLAAKQSVASLPHNATGHTWSHLVTYGDKYIPGHIVGVLAIS